MNRYPIPADRAPAPAPRPGRPHPLQLAPEARDALLALRPAEVPQSRPPVRRPPPQALPVAQAPVVIHRTEPERRRLWPWLGPIARVVLTLLACAGILAIGAVTLLGFVAWYSR